MKARGPFCIRHAAADTFAMVVFCFVTGMIIEIFVSGMTFQQSLASRTLSIPVNIAIAWPYGVFRDYVLRQGRKISPTGWMKISPISWLTFSFNRQFMPPFSSP